MPKITATSPQITAEKRRQVTDQVELPRVYMAWIMPSIFQPGDADADLLAQILGGGKSSRLYKNARLREADRAGRLRPEADPAARIRFRTTGHGETRGEA